MNLDKLLSGETQRVEYKRERSASSKGHAKTVVAFAKAVARDMVPRGIVGKIGDKRYTRYVLPEARN